MTKYNNIHPSRNLPEKYNGFYIRPTSRTFILSSNEIDKAVKVMKKNKLFRLEINPVYCNSKTLDFISHFDFVEELTVLNKNMEDISYIHSLSELKKLVIDHKQNGVLDLTSFPKLIDCSFNWGIKGASSVFDCKMLQFLKIDHYNGFELNEFANLSTLESLTLNAARIVALQGIQRLTGLRDLDLSGCTLLENIDDLTSLVSLEELRLDYCKRIDDFNPISNLIKLKHLFFSDVGDIADVRFISNLSDLRELIFTGTTKVLDGNLNPIEGLRKKGQLKKIIFVKRKFYSHTPEDLGYREPPEVARIFNKR